MNSENWLKFDVGVEESKWIPLRLSSKERSLLKVIQGALDVSEYTDVVDVSTNNYYVRQTYDKSEKIMEQLTDLCQIIVGLGLANDYKTTNQKSMKGMDLTAHEDFVAECMEIGRRYKIMNPDKMRSSYGKLLYVLMDAQRPSIRKQLEGVQLMTHVKTVYSVLKGAEALSILNDPLFKAATRPIGQDLSSMGSFTDVELEETDRNKQKADRDSALKKLIAKYCSSEFSNAVQKKRAERKERMKVEESKKDGEERSSQKPFDSSDEESEEEEEVEEIDLNENLLLTVVNSVLDNSNFLRSNLVPVVKLINYLKNNFDPAEVPKDKVDNLEINTRVGGSCLKHSHSTQFNFVMQSLVLWKNILRNFFQAWILAEQDLLDPRNGHRLCNTGQGMQRCQSAPRVSKFMSHILSRTKSEIRQLSSTFDEMESKRSTRYRSEWVGLSVVHLGDRDVPNALVFIDKYTQISRILNPLVQVLERIDIEFDSNPELQKYVKEQYGGKDNLRKQVLGDYFKHGFDGSGDDGGSCIDGRLTSSWNWCSKLDKKAYYPVFLLAGFLGFDGDFRE